MNTPYSFLLFDLGGVLIDNTVFSRLPALMDKHLPALTLKSLWLKSPSVRQFELGKSSADEFARAFIAEWGLTMTPEAFIDEFSSWPSGFYPRALNVLQDLRRRYRVGCLSNSNVLHWQKFNGFTHEFDIALSSHLLGEIKPDREVFKKALSACNVDAGEVCFFDDSKENVLTATRLGITSYHVEGFNALLAVLSRENII